MVQFCMIFYDFLISSDVEPMTSILPEGGRKNLPSRATLVHAMIEVQFLPSLFDVFVLQSTGDTRAPFPP